MDEHGRGSNHTPGPDEAIRDCACHGTLLVVGGFSLFIQIKWAFPAADNVAFLLCSLSLYYYLLHIASAPCTRIYDAHACTQLPVGGCQTRCRGGLPNPSRVMLCLNARMDSQLKWYSDR